MNEQIVARETAEDAPAALRAVKLLALYETNEDEKARQKRAASARARARRVRRRRVVLVARAARVARARASASGHIASHAPRMATRDARRRTLARASSRVVGASRRRRARRFAVAPIRFPRFVPLARSARAAPFFVCFVHPRLLPSIAR